MKKKKYIKPELKLICETAKAAQCAAGFSANTGLSGTCSSGPSADFACNAGSHANTICYMGPRAIGPSDPSCLPGVAAGITCQTGTSAGGESPGSETCSSGFSPIN